MSLKLKKISISLCILGGIIFSSFSSHTDRTRIPSSLLTEKRGKDGSFYTPNCNQGINWLRENFNKETNDLLRELKILDHSKIISQALERINYPKSKTTIRETIESITNRLLECRLASENDLQVILESKVIINRHAVSLAKQQNLTLQVPSTFQHLYLTDTNKKLVETIGYCPEDQEIAQNYCIRNDDKEIQNKCIANIRTTINSIHKRKIEFIKFSYRNICFHHQLEKSIMSTKPIVIKTYDSKTGTAKINNINAMISGFILCFDPFAKEQAPLAERTSLIINTQAYLLSKLNGTLLDNACSKNASFFPDSIEAQEVKNRNETL